jgi:hypothetical protein
MECFQLMQEHSSILVSRTILRGVERKVFAISTADMCQSAKEMWQSKVGKSEHWEGATGFD